LVRPLKLIANETGGGYYTGQELTGSVNLASGTPTLSMPIGMNAQATNVTVVVFNPPEDGASTHVLINGTNATYGCGLLTGLTQESPPRKVYEWFGSASGGVAYAKLTADWSSGTPNVVSGHPCRVDGSHVDTGTTLSLYVVMPSAAAPQNLVLHTNDVIAYVPFPAGSAKDGLCLPVDQSQQGGGIGTLKYQVYSMTSNTTAGWDFVRAH